MLLFRFGPNFKLVSHPIYIIRKYHTNPLYEIPYPDVQNVGKRGEAVLRYELYHPNPAAVLIGILWVC